jgi:cell division transport system ATP-binding protein
MIQVYHVSKTYEGDITALIDINFHIHKGELVFLTGPSGAGKTTLLRLLYGDETPTAGQILVNGKNVAWSEENELSLLRRNMGIIFQDFRLLKDRSVYENLAFVCRILGYSKTEERRKVAQALALVNLTSKAHLTPYHLSGGEQQRAAVARALVHDPSILLADEPVGDLDPEQAHEIMILLKEINVRGTTVLIATHSPSLSSPRDSHIRLEKGRIVEESGVPLYY